VTDQPMDYRDYLIRKQQQDRMAQRFDALFTKDEDHAAAATQGIENLAYHTAQEAAATLRPMTTCRSR
jgi:N12 class adenine-specific DNA methylase